MKKVTRTTKPKCEATACGNTCISDKYVCRSNVSTSDALALVKAAVARTVGTTNSFSRYWEPAWAGAPAELTSLIAEFDQPTPGNNDLSGSAYYTANTISMQEYRRGVGRADAVWRHEYGHYLDEKLLLKAKKTVGQAALNKAMQKQGYKDFSDALAKSEEDNDLAARMTIEKLRTELGAHNTSRSELAGAVVGAEPFNLMISSSKAFSKAFREDEQNLLSKAKADNAMTDDQAKQFLADNEEHINTLSRMQAKGGDFVAAARSTLSWKRFADADDEITKRYKAIAGKGASKKQLSAAYDQAENEFNLEQVKLVPKDSLIGKMLSTASLAQLKEINVSYLAEAVAEPNNINNILRVAGHVMQSADLVDDLTGSITLNKVGKGHSNEYYEGKMWRQNAEAFANLVAIHGSGHPAAEDLLNYLAPASFKQYKSLLKA